LAEAVQDFSAQFASWHAEKAQDTQRARASNAAQQHNNKKQQRTNALPHPLSIPGQPTGYIALLRRCHLLLLAAVLLLRRRLHRVGLAWPLHPSTGADFCPNSVAGANGPKLRDGPTGHSSSLFSSIIRAWRRLFEREEEIRGEFMSFQIFVHAHFMR
jgi:hypothetical protein